MSDWNAKIVKGQNGYVVTIDKEYDDGTQAYYSRQKWEQAVKAKESTLNLATTEVRQWKAKHPVSGHDIAGYVVAWTPSNVNFFLSSSITSSTPWLSCNGNFPI